MDDTITKEDENEFEMDNSDIDNQIDWNHMVWLNFILLFTLENTDTTIMMVKSVNIEILK